MSERLPVPPAHVAPFVDVLGGDVAVKFLLAFGGVGLSLATSPTERSRLVSVVGVEAAARLAARMSHGRIDVPTARPWVAACLRGRGLSVAEIAVEMRTTEATVRRWMREAYTEADRIAFRARQLDLF